VAGQPGGRPSPREESSVVHDEGNVGGLLVGLMPLLVHAPLGAQHVSVIRGKDDDRVCGHRVVCVECIENLLDLAIHVFLQLVVEPLVFERVRGRLQHSRVRLEVAALAGGFPRQPLLAGRRVHASVEELGGYGGALELAPQVPQPRLAEGEGSPQRDVVGVDERADDQPWAPLAAGEVVQQVSGWEAY
jgi:hypothetical protein